MTKSAGCRRQRGRETNRAEGSFGRRLGIQWRDWWPVMRSDDRWHGWATEETTTMRWGLLEDGAVAGKEKLGRQLKGSGERKSLSEVSDF